MAHTQPTPLARGDVTAVAERAIAYRDLTTLDEYAAVVALEREIWGPAYDEAVPVGILKVTAERGAILVGAFAGEHLVGFVYSLRAVKGTRPIHWSHKLGVLESHRHLRIGHRLKLLQRERALRAGVDLIEWTFDPLQAANAHLNVAKLGVVVEDYQEEFYGASTVPVRHRGNPTDRFVVAWYIRERAVELALSASDSGADARYVETVARANRVTMRGGLPECSEIALDLVTSCMAIEIPTGYSDLLARAPEVAHAWRMVTRQIFTSYFRHGYRVRRFVLDLPNRKGVYLLDR